MLNRRGKSASLIQAQYGHVLGEVRDGPPAETNNHAASALTEPAPIPQGRKIELETPDPTSREVQPRAAAEEAAPRLELSDAERKEAHRALEALTQEIEQQVRDALSEHVMMSPFLPQSIAKTLAEDIGKVNLPATDYDGVVSDEELPAILRRGGEDAKVGRTNGTPPARTGSLILSERLISTISTELCQRLILRHSLPLVMAEELMLQGRERTLMQLLVGETPRAEIESLAHGLNARKALTPTLILRALSVGNLDFFQAAMAARAGLSFEAAGSMIFDRGRSGLEEIYRRSGLPSELFIAFHSAVAVIKESNSQEGEVHQLEITERIMARLRMDYDSVCPEGLEHTLSQLSHFVIGRSEGAARALL